MAEKIGWLGVFQNAKDVLGECGGSAAMFKKIGDNMKGRPLADQLKKWFRG
jgi:hypothetical protein